MSIPPSIRNAFSGWLKPLPILVALLIVVMISATVLLTRPDKPVGDFVTSDAPLVPEEVKDNHRGEGLQRGPATGAAPSKAYPRPASALTDKGYKYGFYTVANWSGRGSGDPVESIVVHVTGPGSLEGMRNWFNNPAAQSSAHFGVGKQCPGTVDQYVEIGDVAWHAGIVNKPNRANPLIDSWIAQGINPNRRTVGIELLLEPGQLIGEYPCMRDAFDDLLVWLLVTLQIPADRVHVVGHYELDAVSRSVDPICCVNLDMAVGYAASRINPKPTPAQLSIEERLLRIEQRLGIE